MNCNYCAIFSKYVCLEILFSKLVILLIAGFIRPVVLLGPIADITRDKLLQDMPDTFAIPSKNAFDIVS